MTADGRVWHVWRFPEGPSLHTAETYEDAQRWQASSGERLTFIAPSWPVGRDEPMTDDGKYRIRREGDRIWPWRVYPPGSTQSLGSYESQKRAMRVAEGHARGADCNQFLMGYCNCRFECAR